jgi:two-component system, OmpR family, heavy metal sensor histidine kinase CusS
MQSLKSRLICGMITGMTVLLIGFDLIIYHTISHTLFSQFDESLKSAANLLSASVEQDNKDNKFDFEFNVERMPEFVGGKKPAYYELRSSDGTVIRKSPSLGSDDLVWFKPVNHSHISKMFKMKNGRIVRAIAANFLPNTEDDSNAANISQPLILIVAYDAGELLEQLRFLKYLLCIVSAGILSLAYIVAEVVVKQGLAPLSAVAAQIDGISENNLKSRISGENLPAEIVPIERQLNSLLSRLEASFEHERTFNANVAHELRTPLAGLRSIVDVALTRNRDAGEYRIALSELLSVINNMEEMVAKLLELARITNGQMAFSREQIKPAELVDKCWQSFSDKAAAAEITFENCIDKNFVWQSDPIALSIIFSNLLNNAAEYTNRGGKIRVTAQKINSGIEIIFENTGNQLTPQQAETVFDCFWQGDASRSSTGVHFGLGLSLVKQMVELLGGKIRAEVSNDLFSTYMHLPLT